MKKLILFLAIFFCLSISTPVLAGGFPNNAIGFHFDSIDGTTCTSTSYILMPAVNYDRTILNIKTNNLTKKDNNGSDVHLFTGTSTFPNQCYDNERQSYSDSLIYEKIPANYPLRCDKTYIAVEKDNHIFIRIIYTDYDLSLVPDYIITATSTIGTTSLNMTSTSSIESISYNAIETNLGNGQIRIEGQYIVPFWLLIFIAFIFILVLYIARLILNKK